MSPHGWLAAVFVILALAGCAEVATGQGRAPQTPFPVLTDRHTHGGVDL